MKKRNTLKKVNNDERPDSLVVKFQTNKNEALRQIIDKYGDRVYATAYSITKNHSDAEEVFQDVFITVYTKIKSLRSMAALSSWIYRIAVNLARLRIRACNKTKTVLASDQCNIDQLDYLDAADRTICVIDQLLDQEARNVIEDAIKELPPEDKNVIVLTDINEMPIKSTSDMLKMSIPAIKSRLHRARKRLRHKLDTYFDEKINEKR